MTRQGLIAGIAAAIIVISLTSSTAFAQRSDLFRRSDALRERQRRGERRARLSFAERRVERGGPRRLLGTDPADFPTDRSIFSQQPPTEPGIFGPTPSLSQYLPRGSSQGRGVLDREGDTGLFGPVPTLSDYWPRLHDR